jgi:hypothetical protein
MDWSTVSLIVGICTGIVALCSTIGTVCFRIGFNRSWAEKERLRGTIDKLTTENVGLKQQIENVKQLTEIVERNNKFNEERWENAQREAAKAGEQLKATEAKLAALEAQKAAGAPQADIDRTTLEIRSSLMSALVANTSSNAILSGGPVRLFFVHPPEEPKKDAP